MTDRIPPTATAGRDATGGSVEEGGHIVVLHGGWQDSWWWRPVHRELRRRGHHCWVPDLPGSTPDYPRLAEITMPLLADTITARIRAHPGLRDVRLIAHSLAGPIAQLVAAQLPQITQVIFTNAWVLADGAAPVPHDGGERGAPALDPDRDDGRDRLAAHLPAGLGNLRWAALHGQPAWMDPGDFFDRFAPDADTDTRQHAGPLVAATPCPPGWLGGTGAWHRFWELATADRRPFEISYLQLVDDQVLVPELRYEMIWALQPDRTATTPGSHQGFHAFPAEFVDALLELTQQPRRCRSGPDGSPDPRAAAALSREHRP